MSFLFAQGVWQQPVLHTQRSDLITIQSVWNDMKKQDKLRQTKSSIQDASRDLPAKLPENYVQVLLGQTLL